MYHMKGEDGARGNGRKKKIQNGPWHGLGKRYRKGCMGHEDWNKVIQKFTMEYSIKTVGVWNFLGEEALLH